MALAEVGRFHTLSEAQVAASVLRSAGIEVAVADAHYGSVFWIEQRALGGFRLSVAEADLADAVEILGRPPEVPPLDDEDALPGPLSDGQRLAAGALLLTAGPAAGWLAAGRARWGLIVVALLFALVFAVLTTEVGFGMPYLMNLLGFGPG